MVRTEFQVTSTCRHSFWTDLNQHIKPYNMPEPPPPKRQKREDYRSAHRADEGSTELPRKKFYRQRAHANPFSDHQLV